MSESHIAVTSQGVVTGFIGKDATQLVAVITLKNGIAGYAKFKMIPTRGWTITRMLARATDFTGKKYSSRKAGDMQRAVSDLQVWVDTMKSALPVVVTK